MGRHRKYWLHGVFMNMSSDVFGSVRSVIVNVNCYFLLRLAFSRVFFEHLWGV